MYSIWVYFPAYLNLQRQLTHLNIAPCPTKANDLHALFGYKKKSKRTDNDFLDDDNIEDEDDDPDDDYEEGVDAEGEIDDEASNEDSGPDAAMRRDKRVRKREADELRKAELKILHAEVLTIVHACSKYKKGSSRKDLKTNIAKINEPWSRASRLTGEAVVNARFPGKHTWHFHTAEYSAISLSSYYRAMPTLAAMILAEASAVLSYCHALILYQPDGGAAYLRHAFETFAAPFLVGVPSTSDAPLQRALSFAKGKGVQKPMPQDYRKPPPCTITWSDGLYNPDYTPRHFSLADEMSEYTRETKLVDQQRALQKAIDHIASIPSAWEDSTGALKLRDKPALHPDVVNCLVKLVEVRLLHSSVYYVLPMT